MVWILAGYALADHRTPDGSFASIANGDLGIGLVVKERKKYQRCRTGDMDTATREPMRRNGRVWISPAVATQVVAGDSNARSLIRSKDTAFQIASPPCRSMCERGIRRQIAFHIPRLFFPTRVRVLPILFLAADGCLRSRAVAVNDGCGVVV